MDVVDYIKALIQTEKKFALPGLGTFNITRTKAKIDTKGKTVSPSSTALTFDVKKKTDDKILAKHIAKKEKISQTDAIKQIKNFIKASEGVLKSGEPLRLPRIGKFKYNADKILIFEPDWLLRPKIDYGLKATKLSTPISKEPSTAKTPVAKKSTNISKPTSKPTTSTPITKPVVKSEEAVKINKPIVKPEVQSTKETPKQKSKKKKSTVIPLILIILIVSLGGLLGYQVYKGKSTMDYAKRKYAMLLSFMHKGASTEEVVKTDTLITENAVEVEDTTTVDYSKFAFNVEYPEGKFKIIVASFQDKKFANKLAAQLTKKGIDANIVQGENSFYRIVIDEANSPDSANELYQTALNLHGDAWVLNTEN